LFHHLVGRALRCKFNHPVREPMPPLCRQPVPVGQEPNLSYPGRNIRKAIHLRNIIIVELRIAPGCHGHFRKTIDRTRHFPVNERNGEAVSGDDIPWSRVTMPDDIGYAEVAAESWAPECGAIRPK
jgi:hypothetical protein